MGLVKKEDL